MQPVVYLNRVHTYVWSEAVLYIFGPKPLYWLTLFAVSIDEVDVTTELPCLCSNVYGDLLSRLTYLVCMYVCSYVIIITKCALLLLAMIYGK